MTPQEVLQYAQFGLYKQTEEEKAAAETKTKVEEENKEKETAEEKYERLNREFNDYRKDQKRKEDLINLKNELNTTAESFEILKEYPNMVKGVQVQTASLLAMNNRLSVKDAMTQVIEERMGFMKEILEKEKDKTHANTKVGARVGQIQTGAAGSPNITTDKPATPADVRSGKSRQVLEDFLSNL